MKQTKFVRRPMAALIDIPSSISSKFLRTHWVGSLHLSASAACRLAFSRIFLSLLLEYIGCCCCQNSVLVSRYSRPWIASVRIALFVTDWLVADSSPFTESHFNQSINQFTNVNVIFLLSNQEKNMKNKIYYTYVRRSTDIVC